MKLVQDLFIDIMPLVANAVVALVVMFAANGYVGLTAVVLLPVYFGLSYWQGRQLGSTRHDMRELRENKNDGLLNLIDSAVVIIKLRARGLTRSRSRTPCNRPCAWPSLKCAKPTSFSTA
jgi:ABC-type multidrug transport system fused ATPase/permease subunit